MLALTVSQRSSWVDLDEFIIRKALPLVGSCLMSPWEIHTKSSCRWNSSILAQLQCLSTYCTKRIYVNDRTVVWLQDHTELRDLQRCHAAPMFYQWGFDAERMRQNCSPSRWFGQVLIMDLSLSSLLPYHATHIHVHYSCVGFIYSPS